MTLGTPSLAWPLAEPSIPGELCCWPGAAHRGLVWAHGALGALGKCV